MNGQRGEPSKMYDNLKDLQGVMAKDDVTVVGFFEKEESFEYVRYIEAGKDYNI